MPKLSFRQLWDSVKGPLITKLSKSEALAVFAIERSKFEAWLKVELCDVLLSLGHDVIPEHKRIDLVFEDWAIELKTINTNFRYNNCRNKSRPITRNVTSLIKDIKRLPQKGKRFKKRGAIFVVFPCKHYHWSWQSKHLPRIDKVSKHIVYEEFYFKGGQPGIIYFSKTK